MDRVTVGMPTEPKAVGKALASIQIRQAATGSIPRPTKMPAGMAMAVPKPAHALQKAAEAPADQQDEYPAVGRHAGEHPLDYIHSPGFEGQVVGEDGGHDNQDDGPQGGGKPLQR